MTRQQVAGYLKAAHGIIVGERMLDTLRRELIRSAQRTVQVRGRSATTGRRKRISVTVGAGLLTERRRTIGRGARRR